MHCFCNTQADRNRVTSIGVTFNIILYRVTILISRAKPPLLTRLKRTYPYNIV